MTTASDRPFLLEVIRLGATPVLKISGSASISEANRFQEKLVELAGERPAVIVLDLSNMDFISSLGLGAIITGHLKCRHHQGQIRLVSPTAAVREILETTRLDTLFGIYESVEKALPKK